MFADFRCTHLVIDVAKPVGLRLLGAIVPWSVNPNSISESTSTVLNENGDGLMRKSVEGDEVYYSGSSVIVGHHLNHGNIF